MSKDDESVEEATEKQTGKKKTRGKAAKPRVVIPDEVSEAGARDVQKQQNDDQEK